MSSLKQAKAPEAEVDSLVAWFHNREAKGERCPAWRRTVHGYAMLVENCCDPEATVLEWKPEIAALLALNGPWLKMSERRPCAIDWPVILGGYSSMSGIWAQLYCDRPGITLDNWSHWIPCRKVPPPPAPEESTSEKAVDSAKAKV